MKNAKSVTSNQSRRLGGVVSSVRRAKNVPPAPWWKRPPKWMAERASTLRKKVARDKPSKTGCRPAATTRWTAALGALGVATAGGVAVALRRRNAEEGPDPSEETGVPLEEAPETPK